jgi:AAA+ superfamily predicted ATPase
MVGYDTSLEHLLEELRRIDLMVRLQVHRFRTLGQSAPDDLRGLYIPEEEIDAILAGDGSFGFQAKIQAPQPQPLRAHLTALEARIAERKATSLQAGIPLRLERLREMFQLSPFDVDAVLVCLAPELDLQYEKLYAYLQDDVTRKRPSVDLVLNLLCPSFETKLTTRHRFLADAPLRHYQLLHMVDDPSHHQPPLLSKYLKADERVVNYLLGSDALDDRLVPCVQYAASNIGIDDLVIPCDIKQRLRLLMREQGISGKRLIVYVQGPYGMGKQTMAQAICRELGLGLLVVDVERLRHADHGDIKTIVRVVNREALLLQAAPYWAGCDALLVDEKHFWRQALVQELDGQPGVAFLGGNITWEPGDAFRHAAFVHIALPSPTAAERQQLWKMALHGRGHQGGDLDLEVLANRFRLSAGHILDAAATADQLAYWRDPSNRQVTPSDLYAACRLQSNRRLGALAQKITPHYKWGDIILPADRLRSLREICHAVTYRSRVYDDWGFDRKLSLGKGLNVLFAGPSGTGKTMAAEVIAAELGLDLYKIDLSTVVSKYIGETEKNLARIFTEAETSNAILFFDEADALFGKRSEVRDAHDRYANIEVGYLLQKMEEYEGVVILATNLRKNMDDAFVRRMHCTVEFPFPSERDRRRIWEAIWPDESPRSHDLDLAFMAHRFELSGGNIRNIALAAAFLAAADGGDITMAHLIQATWREYQKMGKVLMDGEFGAYASLAGKQ